jgi:NADPH2:quinone reductase
MTKALRMYKAGPPSVLKWESVDVPKPGRGEALVRHTYVGLNYIDCYFRSGLYPIAEFPATVGMEGAGVVEAVGPGVRNVKPGDRVAYATMPIGAYAQQRVMPAKRLVKMPKAIPDKTAAAMMLKGMTVEYLIRRTYKVKRGDTVLFHAAAGGVGLIACQWLKHLGATVIGTVGSDEKARLAKRHGCDHTINYRKEDFTKIVREITGGKGVPVVYDSVGKDTFMKSLDCLAPRGVMALFGQASGPVPPLGLGELASRGSLWVTRPSLMTYTASDKELAESAGALCKVVASGKVKLRVNQTYALKDAAQAHRDLESRKTTGSTVLKV